MRLKFILLGFLSVLLIGSMHAQERVSYKIIKDDPRYIFHLKGGASFSHDIYGENYQAGYFTALNLNLGTRVAFGGNLSWGNKKWDNTFKSATNVIDKSMFDISGRASLFFSASIDESSSKITLSKSSWSSGNYTHTEEKFINVPHTLLSQIGFTGSAGFYRNSLLGNVKAGDSLYKFQKVGDISSNIHVPNKIAATYSGMIFSGGFHIAHSTNLALNVINATTGAAYGERKVRQKVDIYIEALYMPVVKLTDNFIVEEPAAEYIFHENHAPDIRNLGWRIRFDGHQTGPFGLGIRLEFGQRPGIKYPIEEGSKIDGGFFALGVFLSFSA